MYVFVHAQGIKTVHARGGGKKWQNSVHVVVECPLRGIWGIFGRIFSTYFLIVCPLCTIFFKLIDYCLYKKLSF